MTAAPPGRPEDPAITLALSLLAAPGGGISTLALDHRDAMLNAYRRAAVDAVDEATMVDAKVRIVEALGSHCSSILLDSAALARCRRPGLSVLMPLEQQGHESFEGGRINRLLDDFSAGDAARLDTQACKLLLYYRSDHRPSAARQLELVATAAAGCHRLSLPLIVEPKVYRLEGEDEDELAAKTPELVVAAARELGVSGADLLKMEFPGSAEACREVSAAAEPLRWTLLGGSDVDAETFAAQLRTACEAGASGFIAGRAIWGGALGVDVAEQDTWLLEHAVPTFEQLVEITDTYARRLT